MEPESSSRALFLRSLRAAFTRLPLWLACWAVPFVLGIVLAAPWVGWFDGAADHAYAAGDVLARLDETFRFDHREDLAALGRQGARLAAGLAFLVVIFGVFSAGGWLQVFLERTSGHSVRRFLWGGARYFWRFLRVAVLTVFSLGLVTALTHGWVWKHLVLDFVFGATDGELEVLDSEMSAIWLGWLQAGLYAALFALVLAWGDYTRTRLALHDTRSALWAGLCTWGLILRHPLRTLRPFVLILVVELAVVFALGVVSWRTNTGLDPGSTWKTVFLLFACGQAALAWQAISRGARYHAAVHVSRKLVQPLFRPDPWAKRVGGPGGPQYPIDDSDEYGVSY